MSVGRGAVGCRVAGTFGDGVLVKLCWVALDCNVAYCSALALQVLVADINIGYEDIVNTQVPFLHLLCTPVHLSFKWRYVVRLHRVRVFYRFWLSTARL